jgi:AraC-like DNA-binding protein
MLAQQLGTNRSYLSKAMNQAFGQNFNAYINHLRIREAIEQIMQKPEGKINITDMALAIGFRNRNPFIDAFKKQTGVTPSVFISNYQKIINDTTQPSQNKIGN